MRFTNSNPVLPTWLRQHLTHALVNFSSWIALVGPRPVHGTWQHYRYNLRFKSALWAAMIVFGLYIVGSVDSWALRLDGVTECFSHDDGSPFPSELAEPGNLPPGVTCEERRPWNAVAYFALLLLIVSTWSIGGRLIADPNRDGALIYRPADETGRIAVRYGLTIEWPEVAEIRLGDLKGLPPEEVERWLTDHMSDQLRVKAVPFAADVAFVKGERLPERKSWRACSAAMQANWWAWCHGETESWYCVNPDDEDAGTEIEA